MWVVLSVIWIASSLWFSKDVFFNSDLRIRVPVFKQEPVISFPYDVELDDASLALGKLWDDKWKNKEVIFQKSYGPHLEPVFFLPHRWESAKTKDAFLLAARSCIKNKIIERNNQLWLVVSHSFLPPLLAFICGSAFLWAIGGFKRH